MGLSTIAAVGWLLAPDASQGALRWRAPAGCPDQAQMEARIEAAGGRGRLGIDAEVVAEDQRWTLRLALELDGARDTRVLEADDCDALAEAAVLLIGVRVDESRDVLPSVDDDVPPPVVEPTPPEPSKPAQPPPRADPEPAVSSEPPPRASGSSQGLLLGAAGGLSIGAVPAPGVPLELAAAWGFGRVRVGVRGRYHFSRRVGLGEGRSVRVHLGAAGPEICARLFRGSFEFPLCAQSSVGRSEVQGRGPTRDRGGLWVEVGADAGLAWSFSPRWALTTRASFAVPVVGTRYVLDERVAFEPFAIHGRVVFGIEFLLPIQIFGSVEKR